MLRAFLAVFATVALTAHAQRASPLANAPSRYVREGADSPVLWEGWGKRAFERAQREKRPIFLAIGSASSFESYRMQREAFLVGETAETLNQYYVPVLLDRFEYPEIAESYATIAKAMNGSGDWPINLVLTTTLEPFAAAGFLGSSELSRFLVINANRWANEREALAAEAKGNVEDGRAVSEKRAPAAIEARTLEAAVDDIAETYDLDQQRFKSNAPQPMTVSFLLRYADRFKNEKIRSVATTHLKKIALTAVHDQLGGGFHRAARDNAWRQPYFEKLLTDQALLGIAYLEAFQSTKDPELERLARSTLSAAIRDLRQRHGGFDTSQAAHNLVPAQGPEFWNGAFYIWNVAEVKRLAGEEGAQKIVRLYGMKEDARNILYVAERDRLADPALAPLVAKLLDVRQKRPQPFREWSVMAGPNGLMMSALARAGAALGEQAYIDAAVSSARLVTTALWNAPKKTLSRSDAATSAHIVATSEDYALLVQGLLDVYEASHDVRWLDLAIELQRRQDQLFWDDSAGRYATGGSVPETLRGLLVERDVETPAVNSVAALNLLRLALVVDSEAWRVRPAMIFQSFGTRLRNDGAQLPQLASALAASLATPRVVVVTGDPRKEATHTLLRSIHAQPEPLRFVVFVPHKGPQRERVTQSLRFTAALAPHPENPVAYECRAGECRKMN